MNKMLITIDSTSEIPIYQQLSEQIILGIAAGDFQNGELLPSVRQMADEIGVNAMTVSKSYGFLREKGYVVTDRRNGTIVQAQLPLNPPFVQELTERLRLLAAEASIHQLSLTELQQQLAAVYPSEEEEK
ncbi:GntR family transcriptional regulator [Enterococcus canis]|uniref:GntR family transcriptional regulator n=2 Tax=Enterococcus canis TaxID=214095 RepID=A0A1L8RJB0_9ENTE|nr:GntR family transcriptional regulator [Enterococcus canis]